MSDADHAVSVQGTPVAGEVWVGVNLSVSFAAVIVHSAILEVHGLVTTIKIAAVAIATRGLLGIELPRFNRMLAAAKVVLDLCTKFPMTWLVTPCHMIQRSPLAEHGDLPGRLHCTIALPAGSETFGAGCRFLSQAPAYLSIS